MSAPFEQFSENVELRIATSTELELENDFFRTPDREIGSTFEATYKLCDFEPKVWRSSVR